MNMRKRGMKRTLEVISGIVPAILILAMALVFNPISERVSHAMNKGIPNPDSKVEIVQDDSAYLHEKPSKNAPIMLELNRGDIVWIIKKDVEWYIVKLPDERLGWMHQESFRDKTVHPLQPEAKDASPQSVPRPSMENGNRITVKAQSARVREFPSISADVHYGLKKGDTVLVIGKKGKWYHIRNEHDKTGWAHSSLFSGSPSITSPSSPSSITPASSPSTTPAPPSKSGPDVKELMDIRVTREDGVERANFLLSGFFPPETFLINSSQKVVCDFYGVRLGEGIKRLIEVNGIAIKKIRIGLHEKPKPKLRVVLDLIPDRDYNVEPTFFKNKENIYVLVFKLAGNE